MRQLAIDLFYGLGGWAEGFLAEGYDVVGFDIERHEYAMPDYTNRHDGGKGTKPIEKRGWTQGCAVTLGLEGSNLKPETHLEKYPAQLVLQDVLTLHGSQFKNAAVIVASPPCQEFSYMAMPWLRGKRIQAALLGKGAFPDDYKGSRTVSELTALFDACFRIRREACETAGHHIPLIVENVRGAHKWVGRSRWHYGSYHLWGDVPALMPITGNGRMKFPSHCGPRMWSEREVTGLDHAKRAIMHREGQKQCDGRGKGGFGEYGPNQGTRNTGSKSNAREAASAIIAKIPFPLARHIARCFKEGR